MDPLIFLNNINYLIYKMEGENGSYKGRYRRGGKKNSDTL
jgi:hypothetical protein